jgi:hypothetical protein
MLLGIQAFGQKKKSKDEVKAEQLDSLTQVNRAYTTQLDSLTKLVALRAQQLDSMGKQMVAHEVLYTAVKDKVIKHDFDPARAGALIDSLKTSREKEFTGASKGTLALRDTVSALAAENARLKAAVRDWETREADNDQVVRDLEQLKGLLDQKIITPSEFDQRKTKLLAKWR